MKIKCHICNDDKKYTQTELEDHFKDEHIADSLIVEYVGLIFKIYEKDK